MNKPGDTSRETSIPSIQSILVLWANAFIIIYKNNIKTMKLKHREKCHKVLHYNINRSKTNINIL